MLATHKTLVDSFRNLSWPVNDNAPEGQAILVGRYPEDTYYDGGAWPLCTFACAEMLYDAVAQIKRAGTLSVDSISLTFFQDLSPDVKIGNYTGQEMHAILANMSTYADGFVRAVQQHLPTNGSISEQFNHTTGSSTSASKLTWSFASFVTMSRRRASQFPPSWGADTAPANTNLTAAQCKPSSYNGTGTYAPAVAAGAPNITTPCEVEVLFTVNATTQFGQNVYLAGNVTKLGGVLNDPGSVILPLNPGNYTSERPEWYVDIWLQAGQTVAYQYVLQNGDEFVFETGQNQDRTVKVPACGGEMVMTDDVASFS
ncbi:hypothetical protein LTR20_002817 [Exophiala xenobiotica]|nr:hypothetical protein LTS13_000542 [Exophiala xenobiotica]KAK5403678.1 hypothetical protein LTR79_000432 [Exophiala xenobiotica]KAK5423167.1 hypothetical protein LTR90_002186 [Exophiala xenobiotica]KAK5468472.1 hypothetical protein LTR20_002817 [Exophiala xenobiotica]KAK5495692.1 hypothetical protein LTR26_002309 [Exophiala xenobiotica]